MRPTQTGERAAGVAGSVVAALLLCGALLCIAVAGAGARHGRQWVTALFGRRVPGIIIHHTATPAVVNGRRVDAAFLDEAHARRGWSVTYEGRTYHIGYHYVILPDGTVQGGRPEAVHGAHTQRHNQYIGICLVGNFSSSDNPLGRQWPSRPTDAQLKALVTLIRDVAGRYGLGPSDLYRHRDFAETACPGDRFPMEEVRQRCNLAARGARRPPSAGH